MGGFGRGGIVMVIILAGLLVGCAGGEEKGATDAGYVADNTAVEDADAQGQAAVDYLLAQVPEIEEFRQMIQSFNADNNTANALVIYLNGEPDPTSSDIYRNHYYDIYVGEDLGSHTSRYATFLVSQDLQEILVEDPASGDYLSLEDWRRQ